tara:strand:+ start:130 stop:732 length:603 start_codon:yes stop_codon:yes gene_type:complete
MIYKVVREAISKELAEFCYEYFCTKRKVAKLFIGTKYIPNTKMDIGWGYWNDIQAPKTYCVYGDIVMETLLTKLHPLMETETETKLYPTYSYARLYKKGDALERHTDRASCKISTTLNLGGDPWPIFLEPSGAKGKKGISVLLEAGDMLLYDGVNHEHWREAFEGESCGQVFLHYRDDKENECDGRPFLGLPVTFKGSRV